MLYSRDFVHIIDSDIVDKRTMLIFSALLKSYQVYVSTQHLDFDLSDPNMYMVSTKYRSLTDPNLWHYHRQPIVRKLIERNQQLTSDSRVRCRLAELNHYRAYLKHLGLKQFEKQREEEVSSG